MTKMKTQSVGFKAKMKSGAVEFSGITKVDVNNTNGGDYHFITFVLDDKTNLGLKFRPMPSVLADSPFWIQAVAKGCPTAGAEMPGVVEPLFVSPDGTELTVINYNAKIEEMYFALRMVDTSGNGHDYDPIMNNQNGGRSPASADFASIATIGIGVASIAAILYASMYGGVS